MFQEFKKALTTAFTKLSKDSNFLFYAEVDREKVWEEYLSGLDPDLAKENKCNACRSFLRQYSGIVGIDKAYVRKSVWDLLEAPEDHAGAVQNLRDYVKSLPITDVFFSKQAKCGTDKTFDPKTGTNWQHLYIELPSQLVRSNVDTVRSDFRSGKSTFQRGLAEIPASVTEEVLELISENGLYNGNQFKTLLETFLRLQKQYAKLGTEEKENFSWLESATSGPVISRVRSSVIGTLLVDLASGVDFDRAVASCESKLAPTNYKRPKSVATKGQIEKAMQTIESLGLRDSLNRRFANDTDIKVSDVIYRYRPTTKKVDLFNEMLSEVAVNPSSIKNPEEVSIDDFIKLVVPKASMVELLFERKHFPNLVSLIAPEDSDSPSLFKWDNKFSWSYTGNLASSMREQVKAAGGKVDGVLRFSIQWDGEGLNNNIDFDAHAFEPSGEEIYFGACRKPSFSRGGGQLDVDIINTGGRTAVENIYWGSKNKMKPGVYKFFVNNYSSRESNGGFSAEVEFNGQIFEFSYPKNLRGKENVNVAEVTLDKNGNFSLKSLLDSNKTTLNSQERWGIGTNKWHKVTNFMFSPNYWVGTGGGMGHKHFIFTLENCLSDEKMRTLFNEYLRPELVKDHKNVFEIIGGKTTTDGKEASNQLSGVGFSDTQRETVFVRVTSDSKQKIYKINF